MAIYARVSEGNLRNGLTLDEFFLLVACTWVDENKDVDGLLRKAIYNALKSDKLYFFLNSFCFLNGKSLSHPWLLNDISI